KSRSNATLSLRHPSRTAARPPLPILGIPLGAAFATSLHLARARLHATQRLTKALPKLPDPVANDGRPLKLHGLGRFDHLVFELNDVFLGDVLCLVGSPDGRVGGGVG